MRLNCSNVHVGGSEDDVLIQIFTHILLKIPQPEKIMIVSSRSADICSFANTASPRPKSDQRSHRNADLC